MIQTRLNEEGLVDWVFHSSVYEMTFVPPDPGLHVVQDLDAKTRQDADEPEMTEKTLDSEQLLRLVPCGARGSSTLLGRT